MKTILKKTLLFSLILVSSWGLLAQHKHKSKTQIKVESGIQVAFDLTDSKGHENMMKMMGIKKNHDKGSDHYVLLTIADKAKKQLVKNAKVTIIITFPSGKKVTKKAHIMEGKKMYHYAVGFKKGKMGDYKVKAKVTVGKKKIKPEVKFHVM